MDDFKISFNIRFGFNKYDMIDGDPKGIYIIVNNETLHPMMKKKFKTSSSIPIYVKFFSKKELNQLIRWLIKTEKFY